MNSSLFENNLSILKARFPVVADKVLQISLQDFPVELVSTKTGVPSVRLSTPANPKPLLLHSAYDPFREANRWAEGIEIPQPTNIVVMGAGLGYHLLTLQSKHEKNIRFLFIIESNPHIFRLALNTVDLRRILTREGTELFIGESPEDIPELIGEKRTDIILHNCKILNHEPSLRCFPNYYAQARDSIIDALTYDEINLRTTFENRGRNQFNIFMNLPAIYKGYALKDCEHLFEGYPAIVSAAGPSLDKNAEFLRDLNGKAILIIVDTAQKTFMKYKIRPHFIVTADPTPLNFSHFEKIDDLESAFLAFHPEVNRQITQKFINHPFLLPLLDAQSDFLNDMFDPEEFGSIPRAMNVGHIAFHLAVHLGCAPITLIGFDMAFPRYGGTTHAADAAMSRSIAEMEKDGTVSIGSKEGKAIEETGKMMLVPGYYGEPVPTTVPFAQYIKAIERTVAECSFEVINATEGGAELKGTTMMPLAEVLQRTLSHAGVEQRLDDFKQQRRSQNLDAIINYMEKGIHVLKSGRKSCDQLASRLNQWQQILSRKQIGWPEANRQWKEFEEIWLAMVSNPLFDAFLGSSVKYLYYCRQRSERPADDSANAFLQCMYNKYTFIINEMTALLDHYIHLVELSLMSVKTLSKD